MIYEVLLLAGICVATSNAANIPLSLPPCVCTREYNPVCGTDGQTYSNTCMLNCTKTKKNDLDLAKLGPCEEEQKLCICTFEYKPVCGSDGQTYPNKCALGCEETVRMAHEGQCAEKVKVAELNIPPPCTCTREKKEICGSDGITYANPCLLNCATANDNTLRIASEGPCNSVNVVDHPDNTVNVVDEPAENTPCVCTRDSRPVCGSDGNTYSNPCMLNCAAQTNPGLSLARHVPCSAATGACTCTRELMPVCASDGQTYASSCIMRCRNPDAEISHDGPCEE